MFRPPPIIVEGRSFAADIGATGPDYWRMSAFGGLLTGGIRRWYLGPTLQLLVDLSGKDVAVSRPARRMNDLCLSEE